MSNMNVLKVLLIFPTILFSLTVFGVEKQIELNLPKAFEPIEWALKEKLKALRFIENGRLAKEIEVKHDIVIYEEDKCKNRQTLGYTLTRPGSESSDTLMYIGISNCFKGVYGDKELENIVENGFQIHFYTRPIFAFPRGGRIIFNEDGKLIKVNFSHSIPFESEKDMYFTGDQCLSAVKDFGRFSVSPVDFVKKYTSGVHSSVTHAFHGLFELTCHSLSKGKMAPSN